MTGERPLFPNSQLVTNETRKRWRERILFILEYPDSLTDWEAGFVQDVEKQLFTDRRDLSLSQSSKLNQIFHKVEEAVG